MRRTILLTLLLVLVVPAAAARAQDAPPPRLTVVFDQGGDSELTVDYGRGATLVGTLVDGAGQPIGAADLQISARTLQDGAGEQFAGTVTTDQDGGFEFDVPPGVSRELAVYYQPGPPGTEPAAVAKARFFVHAGARLSAAPRRLRNGQSMKLTGSLLGKPLPDGGKLVELQVRRGRHWLTFVVVRAGASGTFRYRYRFRATLRTRTYKFRALVPAFTTYPYVRGASRSVAVRVRAR